MWTPYLNKEGKSSFVQHDKLRSLLKFSLLAGLCFTIEPVFSYFDNGQRWFQKPRFLPKRTDDEIRFRKGLFVRKKRNKVVRVYYFNTKGKSAQNPSINSISKKHLNNFTNNLVKISCIDLIKDKTALAHISESNLVEYVLNTSIMPEKKLRLLMNYANISQNFISANFIDLFTKYACERRSNPISGLEKALPKVLEGIRLYEESLSSYSKSKNNISLQHAENRIINWKNRTKLL